MSLRPLAVRAVKRVVQTGLRSPTVRKLANLIAEEYSIVVAAEALAPVAARLGDTVGLAVRRGPFAGLRYPSHDAVGSSLWPKLLGSYEAELASAFDALCATPYRTVVDVGAAEGYYAVGLGRRLPGATIYAFEVSPKGQALISEMAQLNATAERTRVRGWCDVGALAGLDLSPETLVVLDCEGAEYDLLDTGRVPALARCDLVIELHKRPGVVPRAWMLERFGRTHDVAFIDPERRRGADYPELASFTAAQRDAVLFERTDANGWAVLRAHR